MFVGQKKTGMRFSRIPVWQDCFAILLGRGDDFGLVTEVEIVVAYASKLDPSLNDSGSREACVHRHRQCGRTGCRHRYRGGTVIRESPDLIVPAL